MGFEVSPASSIPCRKPRKEKTMPDVAMAVATLVYGLKARKLRYGVAALCIGGGMGVAMAIEAL